MIFANGMGVDTLSRCGNFLLNFGGLLYWYSGCWCASGHDAVASDKNGVMGMTMAFLTLSMVEMFPLNMRSRRNSIF